MGASLSAQSPEVERMNAAVAELNVAEALLVRDLPGASPCRAAELAGRVAVARQGFDTAWLEFAEDAPTGSVLTSRLPVAF